VPPNCVQVYCNSAGSRPCKRAKLLAAPYVFAHLTPSVCHATVLTRHLREVRCEKGSCGTPGSLPCTVSYARRATTAT